MLQFSEKLLNNLMQIGLTVSLAALVPLILRRLMKKRYPARMVCVVWAILALRLLIPVQLTLPQRRCRSCRAPAMWCRATRRRSGRPDFRLCRTQPDG